MQPVFPCNRRVVLQTTLLLVLFIGSCVWPGYTQVLSLPQPENITDRQGLPQSFVPAIVQDRQGFIWMATRDGLCRYDGNHFKVFQPATDGKPGITSSSLSDLSLDPQGRIWVFSDQSDIDVMDPVRETFINFSRQPFFKRWFGRDIIDTHFIDRQGRLWISFLSDKVVCIDPVTHRFSQYKRQAIPGYFPSFSAFVQDRLGTIWMSDKTGLYQLDQRVDQFIKYPLPDNDIRGLHHRHNGDLFILSSRSVLILRLQTGRIQSIKLPIYSSYNTEWHHTRIVSDSKGNEYFNQYNILYRFSDQTGISVLTQLDNQTGFRSMFVDHSDVLWAGTNKIGVLKYNLKATTFTTSPYQTDFYHDLLIRGLGIPAHQVPSMPKDILPYNFRYTLDKAGKLWFNMGNNLFYQVDLKTKRVEEVPFPFHASIRQAWTDPVTPMATDPEGKVWVVTDSMAMWYERNTWTTLPFPIRSKSLHPSPSSSSPTIGVEGQILQLVVDDQALWLATNTHGLYRLDRRTGQINQYRHQPSRPTSLSSDQLFCIFTDPLNQHILWIGTFGSGLCRFDKRNGTCRRFTTQDGLPNNVVYAAIPDRQGSLCIATNQGICLMNRQTFQTRTYTHEDGLLEDEFNRFHFLHLQDDQIILGGLRGITSFYPGQLRDDTYQPLSQITDIRINNRPSQLIDSLPAQAVNHLDLRYDQNFITVNFAALQYNRQAKIRYRYQLTGLNEQWVETDQAVAGYTDLRWGHYKLRLNASNTSGIWSKHIRDLIIVIRPPWWATWWAISLYVIATLSLFYGLIQAYLNRQEAKHLKAIDTIKKRFYTNITHEFRTPLTLIMAPVEQLKQRLSNPNDKEQLELISRNANQLLGLVNQLMELSKAEANVLKVKESQGDLLAFLTRIVQSFEIHAAAKGIQVLFQSEKITTYYWFDADKLEQIVYNLLANALKFTPVGGRVIMSLKIDNDSEWIGSAENHPDQKSRVHLEISDNGIGISPEKIPYIFNRFYQIDDASLGQQDGTGIGLALVKELVEIQQGTIQVVSKVSIGTTFLIDLPYRPVPDTPASAQETTTIQQPEVIQTLNTQEKHSDESPVVLIVEDNQALSDFIADNLPPLYRVYRASDGAEGWEKALQVTPDLIISDVLMPVMNGFELCQKLKNDLRTSHIPIVLLTAKTSIDSKLEGLTSGADDYIVKPFYVQELQLRVHNLLEQRRQLRKWVLATVTNPDQLPAPSSSSDPLIEKLCQIIEQHLDDTAFGVEELIMASGMSRMNLHRKLKALADISTGEFIRNYRLKRAAQLLRQGHTVSETAYLVGFEDPSYFTRSFRKLYQMTPSGYSRRK